MRKLTVLLGLPASGKTTKAKELCASAEADSSIVRINEDDLKSMYRPGNTPISYGIEHKILSVMYSQAESFLRGDYHVIIDGMNYDLLHSWDILVQDTKSTIEYINIDTPVHECLRRNATRKDQIPCSESHIYTWALRNHLLTLKEAEAGITVGRIRSDYRLSDAQVLQKNKALLTELLGMNNEQ